MFYASAMMFGALAVPGPVTLGPWQLAGALGAVAFFLMIRVFDEHKDYAEDVQNYPDRLLSRGVITLDHLKAVGAVAILVQAGVSLGADGGLGASSWRWIIVFAYSLLMLREFFIGEWLSKRLVLYAASHMVVTPLAMLWFCQLGAGQAGLPGQAAWLAVLSFAGGAAFELTRKTRGPEEERDTVASYSRSLGLTGAVAACAASVVITAVAAGVLLSAVSVELPWLAWLGLAAVTLVPLGSLVAFARQPSLEGRERNEKLLGVFLLACHVGLVASVVVERGVSWG